MGRVALAVADINGDGRLDLITANEFSNDVSVLLGNGDGTFEAPRSIAVGSIPVALAGRTDSEFTTVAPVWPVCPPKYTAWRRLFVASRT